MKPKLIGWLFCIATGVLFAGLARLALAQTVTLPVNMTATVTLPAPKPSAQVILPSNVIDPAIGQRLVCSFVVSTNFVLGNFPAGSFTTFLYRNPNGAKITWPSGIIWLTPAPTTQARGYVFFEAVSAGAAGVEVWASQ